MDGHTVIRLPAEAVEEPAVLHCLGCGRQQDVVPGVVPPCMSCADSEATRWVPIAELREVAGSRGWHVVDEPPPDTW